MPLPASRSSFPGDVTAAHGSGANFTALLAARKFRANAVSEDKREERRAAGAKLRAELPPGPLPDDTPPSTSKLLARLMSRDGMTPGDRARKQARLREMQVALAAKENVSPDVGEDPSSRDSRVERLESPTIYMSQPDTDEKRREAASPSDMDLSATETAPLARVPTLVAADAGSEVDFTTPDAGPRSTPRSPNGANDAIPAPDRETESERPVHAEAGAAASTERRARDQERAETGALLAAAKAAELVAEARARAEAEAAEAARARADAAEAAAEAARAERDAMIRAEELAAARRAAEEEAREEAARLAEETRVRREKAAAKAAAKEARAERERAEAEAERQKEREAREAREAAERARVAEQAAARAELAEKTRRENEEKEARARAEAMARLEAARLDAEARAEAEAEARREAEADAKEARARFEAEAKVRARFEAEAKARFESEAKRRAEAEAEEGRARAEAAEKARARAAENARAEAEAAAKARAEAEEADEARAEANAAEAKASARAAFEAAERVRARLSAAEPVEATASSADAPGTPPESAPTSPAAATMARSSSPARASPSCAPASSPRASALPASAASAAAPFRASPRRPAARVGSPGEIRESRALARSVSPPWSVRSARTAEEEDELPLHAALAAGAEHALVRRLLDVDPGGAFVKDAAGDLPLHVALRAAAAPATVEALLRMFPESSAKRDRDGLTPSQLAVQYEDPAEEQAVAALVRSARAEVRRNAEKLCRRAPPRAVERVALEAAARALAATARTAWGLGARAAKVVFFPARQKGGGRGKRGMESPETDAANPASASKSRRRKLFEGETRDRASRGGKTRRGREGRAMRRALRRAVFGFLAKGCVAVGAAYGGALAASAARRDFAARLGAFRRESREPRASKGSAKRFALARLAAATPDAESALARKRVDPEPASVPDDAPRARDTESGVPAVLETVPTIEAEAFPAPTAVALLPEELVRIDAT